MNSCLGYTPLMSSVHQVSYKNTSHQLPLFLRRRTLLLPQSMPSSISLITPPHAFLSGCGGGGVCSFIQDAGAASLALAGGFGLVKAFDFLTYQNFISQNLSRKLVHILSGLFFMLSWPLFSTSTDARYFASLVPLANGLRLVVYGLSLLDDKGLVNSVTRGGKPEELLQGPLYYVLILALCAVAFWRESPVGLVSLAMMSGGDGVADIIGRKFGAVKIPYNKNKSWAGSIAMFTFGFLTSILILYYFSSLGYFQLEWISTMKKVAVISFLASVVESFPSEGFIDDNLSVPLVTMITAYVCFSL